MKKSYIISVVVAAMLLTTHANAQITITGVASRDISLVQTSPNSVVVTSNGDKYVVDVNWNGTTSVGNRITKSTVGSTTQTTFATFSTSPLVAPKFICLSNDGLYLYAFTQVASVGTQVYKVSLADGTSTLYAGNTTTVASGSNTATVLPYDVPAGLAIDASDNLYLGYKNTLPRKIAASNQAFTILGAACITDGNTNVGDGGAISTFKFGRISSLAFDKVNNVLYLSDTKSIRVRKFDFANDLVSTYAGNGTAGTTDNVVATSTSTINDFQGLSVDLAGNLYIIDRTGGKIRKVDYITKVISTVATGYTAGNLNELFVNPNAQEYYTTNKFSGTSLNKTTGDVALHVPSAPGSLTTSAIGSTTATLTWTASGTTGATYEIFKDGNSIGTTATGVLTYDVSGLTAGNAYSFVVKSVIGTYKASSNTLSVTPSTTPSAPTITSITPANTSLSVAFTAGATGGSAITNYKYSTDGGSSWTSAGTTTSPISITGLSNGVTYNVQLRAVNANGDGTATASTQATTTAISGAVTASDLNLTPSSAVQVAAGAALTIDNNQSFSSITVAQGGKLTISNAPTLSGTITLESTTDGTATLVDDYSDPTVSAIVKQHVTAGRNWYLSPAVSTAGYGWLSRGTSVQEWNEVTKAWVVKSSGTLTPGKGYVQVATSTPSVTGTTGTVDVTGTTNSGTIPLTVTRTESGSSRGFNLVGNPYPSYLNWDDFYAETANAAALLNSFWLRTKNNSEQYVFTTYNGASHTVVGGTTVPTDLNNFIPPMQAFWVRVKQNTNTGDLNYPNNSASITFKNNMRGHIDAVGNTSNNKFKAPKANERRTLRLQLTNGIQSDESLIYFDAAAANTFDNYDSPKMLNNSSVLPDLYSVVGTERLAINGLAEATDNMSLPLGFTLKAPATGLTLKVSEISNFAAGAKVYLMDNEQNTQTELLPESEYTFNTSTSTVNNESRFTLLFRAPGVATGVENTGKLNVQVYVNAANQITILAPEKSVYSIYNAVGMLVENGQVTSNVQTSNFKHVAGVYVVRLVENGKSYSTRVVINSKL